MAAVVNPSTMEEMIECMTMMFHESAILLCKEDYGFDLTLDKPQSFKRSSKLSEPDRFYWGHIPKIKSKLVLPPESDIFN
jgi:hypothetical protein